MVILLLVSDAFRGVGLKRLSSAMLRNGALSITTMLLERMLGRSLLENYPSRYRFPIWEWYSVVLLFLALKKSASDSTNLVSLLPECSSIIRSLLLDGAAWPVVQSWRKASWSDLADINEGPPSTCFAQVRQMVVYVGCLEHAFHCKSPLLCEYTVHLQTSGI